MYFHIDMNSYFASVEQQYDSKLRGKPIGVCAYLSKNGCIIASSIEAKRFGVTTGMRVQEALKLCPTLRLVENDPKKYRAATTKIFLILKDYSDEFEPYSIDEAFLNIPYVHNEQEGFDLGLEWNQRIKREVGEYLRSSVGFAQNRFYAKVFSDNGPKDSVFHVSYPQLDNFLASLELEDVWGIGRKIATRLRTLKLFTPLDVKGANPDRLVEEFGKYGYELWQNLNHITHTTYHGTKNPNQNLLDNNQSSCYVLRDPCYVSSDYPKSVGHSYCLPLKTYNLEAYKKILYKLCERTCVRLREMNKVAYGISFAFPLRNKKVIARQVGAAKQSSNLTSKREDSKIGRSPSTNHSSFKTTFAISDALDMYHQVVPHLENQQPFPLYMIAVSLFHLPTSWGKLRITP